MSTSNLAVLLIAKNAAPVPLLGDHLVRNFLVRFTNLRRLSIGRQDAAIISVTGMDALTATLSIYSCTAPSSIDQGVSFPGAEPHVSEPHR